VPQKLVFDASSLIVAAKTKVNSRLVLDDVLLRSLHAQYLRGDITLRRMASQLGLTYRELYEGLEQRGLPLQSGHTLVATTERPTGL
jgi:hypothetical protein